MSLYRQQGALNVSDERCSVEPGSCVPVALKHAGKLNAISIKRNQQMSAEKFIHVF